MADRLSFEITNESPVVQRLDIEVEPERVDGAYDRAYRELSRTVKVRGFRPGKTPRSVLERLYGAGLGEQIEQTLVSETLGEAVQEAELQPVSEPTVESGAAKPGEPFRYTARIEIKPPIELPDLVGLPAQRPRVEVTDEDVDAELQSLRERSAPVVEEPDGTAIAEGHMATLDFVGRVDGEPFEGGRGQGVEVEVGSGQFVPGFEEGLIGATADEDREIRVTFPEDYGNDALAGKEAVFAAHVVAIKRKQVPELDDEFAKDLGDFETLEDLRTRVREDMTTSRERSADAVLHRTLLESLAERAPFEVPQGMVERRVQQELAQAHQRLEGQVSHDELHAQLARWREEWRDRSEQQVREALLLEAVVEQVGIGIGPEEVEARVQEMAAEHGVDAARLRQLYGGEGLDQALQRQMADEKALEFLSAQAKVEETTDT